MLTELLPADRRLCWIALIGGAVFAIVVAYFVAIRGFYLGNGAMGWVYGYPHRFRPHALTVFLYATLLTLPLLYVTGTGTTRRDWLMVILWLLVAFAVQGMIHTLSEEATLEQAFVSDNANGYYGVTRHLFASTVLAELDRVRASFPPHVGFNMPGKLMFVYGLKNLSKRTDTLAWLVVVVSNLGGVFCFLFARELFEDRRVALYSLVLYLLAPGKLFFLPLLNTVTPVVIMAWAYLFMRCLRSRNPIYPALLGAGLYGLIFYEPLPLVLGLMFLALGAAAIVQGTITVMIALRQVAIVILGFAVTHAAMVAGTGFNLLTAFQQAWRAGTRFNVDTARPYWFWVRENLIDFGFGVGICQMAAFFAALWIGLVRRDRAGRRFLLPIAVLTLSLLATLLATDLTGIHRGESTREWIFLACFFQIPAAYVCAKLNARAAIVMVVTTTLLLDTLGTSMIGFIRP